jgi:glycosyltransferase involved in cell wall biosynthesis
MRILAVSRAWPSTERSGVSLAAAAHVEMMVEMGHDVSIIGACAPVLQEDLPVEGRFHVPAYGSGALYSPSRVDHQQMTSAITRANPELIVVEAWQTGIGEAAIQAAKTRNLPVLMISHGVSIHPFSKSITDRLRALGWIHYRYGILPRMILNLTAITTLDEASRSLRFYDRDIARQFGIPVFPLGNFPVNWSRTCLVHNARKRQVLLIGYFSPVKNQLSALEILSKLSADMFLRFIGPRSGEYYLQCVRRASELGVEARVIFSEDHECNISDEIASSIAVLSTSITEALPICLLEAMASGTPFVATPVGAVPSLSGGLIRTDVHGHAEAIQNLMNDAELWNKLSNAGIALHHERFSRISIKEQLSSALLRFDNTDTLE